MWDWCKAKKHSVAVENTEPGASATDNRRPIFQQMIAEACVNPPPFDAIIIHSLSRFFRDSFQFTFYERQLKKAGVQIISITQQTSGDSAGEMARSIFSLFDEYQSKENAKHTLRAMKENARQGFFNGSSVPYGFQKIETSVQGNKGQKKRLEINPSEAAIVDRIFHLYLSGHQGQALGVKGIAAHLNERGITMRGKRWGKTLIHDMLSNRLYLGEYDFNKTEAKTRRVKPEEEWITVSVDQIVEIETFEQVQKSLLGRSPAKVSPRVVSSPSLLTGLVKCGICGSSMTIATGAGGRYRYYKCYSRIKDLAKSSICEGVSIPMEKLDALTLEVVSRRVFTPERVEIMMKELQKNLKNSRKEHDEQLNKLKRELNKLREQTDRLYESVENGLLPLNNSLHERIHKHEARRKEILTEMAGLKRQKELPLSKLGTKHVKAFCSVIKEKMFDRGSNFGKEYLKLLVDKINVSKKEVRLSGRYAALAGALCMSTKIGSETLPTFVLDWLPIADSK